MSKNNNLKTEKHRKIYSRKRLGSQQSDPIKRKKILRYYYFYMIYYNFVTLCLNLFYLNGIIYRTIYKEGFLHMKKKILPSLIIIGLLILVLCIFGISTLIKKYSPTDKKQDLTEYFGETSDDSWAIVVDEEITDSKATIIDGHIYVDNNFISKYLNSRFYWDSNENVLLYATSTALISVEAESNSYLITKSSVDFGYPIVKATSEGSLVALDFVKEYSNFTYKECEKPNRVVFTTKWGKRDVATVDSDTQIRVKGGIKSPILEEIEEDSTVFVLEKGENWTKVLSENGFIGYIKNSYLSDTTNKKFTNKDYQKEDYVHIMKDDEICLGWQLITNQSANSNIANVLSKNKAINVVAPTWFSLKDNKGNISDNASSSYVSYCHSQNIDVWGVVNNLDYAEADSAYVLTHTSTRTTLVNQIISVAIKYELDGINLDFELISKDAHGDSFIQFIRELAIKCHNNGITLSVDVTVPASYNKFFNRKDMANFADYIVIMGYDEHYKGSDAGSVASLGWVEDGLKNTLDEVPAEQVILGMPIYTRIWELTPNDTENVEVSDSEDSSNYTVSSSAYGIDKAYEIVNQAGATPTWDAECGQNYAEWTSGDIIYKVWLEDTSSLEERLKLVDENKIAGAAFWKLGFENSEYWDTVIKYIN